ncbi:hypothetical protein ASC77_13415 [Nocardioides sp. Root1257]|uniref:hypothetical protein n=1 Tax=unclassified Nocardioides TaxID=2615069 RepID=UPI0006FF2CC5|nr:MULTISPECIES: hypothetical protein [unclassified Nocardioides]KQW47453.1 hypothetical protein ASC77_13415 [Nocardioides sp. Root1257]KRC45609.1 hypothetical protein ASE24_13420 [Nocardioides sp. Root224]
MTTLRIRVAVATLGGADLPQPYVCEDLDAVVRLDADVYVGCGVTTGRHQQAWWRKMREAGLETYHRHDDAPVSTRLPVLHPWTAAIRLDLAPATQVLGPQFSGRRLERCRGRGVTSIIAGELGERPPAYHPEQVVVAHVGTVGIVVVPAPGVEVVLSGELGVPTTDLHGEVPVFAADLDLRQVSVRAGRGSAEAPVAAPWPPRPVDRDVRVAR